MTQHKDAAPNADTAARPILWDLPEMQAANSLALTAPAFAHEAIMPPRYRGRLFRRNASPALFWDAPPEATAELLLVMQDPDALHPPATHLLVAGIAPTASGIPEAGLLSRSASPELIFGRGPLGLRGWIGPMPPQSHGPHRYVLQLFAIDRRLGLSGGFTLQAAVAAASEHVIARGRLDGFYEAHSHRG